MGDHSSDSLHFICFFLFVFLLRIRMKRKQLEEMLQDIEGFPAPKIQYEQYPTVR